MNPQEESIYNLIEKEKEEVIKQKRYKSKHDPKAQLTYSTFDACRSTNRTFGLASKTRISAKEFLKKRTRPTPVIEKEKVSTFKRAEINRKPAVPSKEEKPILGLSDTDKDFVMDNVVEAITMFPPAVDKPYEDFMKVDGYGTTPKYLTKIKKNLHLEQEMINELTRQQFGRNEGPQLERMDEEERKDLIRKLKTKWDALNTEYQKKSHCKILEGSALKLKETQERELDQLKHDIMLLSQPGPIYIE